MWCFLLAKTLFACHKFSTDKLQQEAEMIPSCSESKLLMRYTKMRPVLYLRWFQQDFTVDKRKSVRYEGLPVGNTLTPDKATALSLYRKNPVQSPEYGCYDLWDLKSCYNINFHIFLAPKTRGKHILKLTVEIIWASFISWTNLTGKSHRYIQKERRSAKRRDS